VSTCVAQIGTVVAPVTDHAHLREAGARVDDEVMRMPGGVPPTVGFTDPDGSALRTVQRP
jgi:hypothetical protein